ncbi:MAG: competence/damage-inducible protein A [Armatimonadetes bacterium]|nr:competence/damage-inducible protein A [Armatimonadota bacterium]
MRAEIVSVGTELLLGQIVDTNAAHLSRILSELGIDVYYRSTVGDNLDRIVDAIRLALSRSDLVFTIGGLGPTEDDLTKEAVAKALGVELALDEESANWIREFFAARGLTMPERNLKQALGPKTGEGRILLNEVGTAPGAIFEKDGKIVIILPGPPGEFATMIERGVVPYLREKTAGVPALIKSRVLKIAGLGESAVEERVRDLIGTRNPTVAPLAHLGEIHLRITAKAEDAATADRMIREVESKLRDRLGDYVFGADEDTIEQVILERLVDLRLTVSFAESCTGGLLSHRITNISGSSAAFIAGIVSYSNESKSRFLGVPAELIERHGAVSGEAAKAMASGVRVAVGTSIGMGITGIAGPGGGTPTKPVGLVYIALSAEDIDTSEEYRFAGTRLDIKQRASQAALAMLRRYLLQLSPI